MAMTKKQKDMLKRILVTAVLYVALVAADHMKMIPAEKLSAADIKNLYHRIRAVTCTRHHVTVGFVICRNFLLLCHLLNTLD